MVIEGKSINEMVIRSMVIKGVGLFLLASLVAVIRGFMELGLG